MNLKTLDLEKLSVLPYRQSIKTTLNGKLNTYTICGWDCYNSYWNNETCRKIRHILENSMGKHIDDIHSKVSKMNHIYPYSTEDVIAMYIKGDERHKYFNIDKIWYGRLYINKEGIITKSPAKPYKSYKNQVYRKKQLAEIKFKKHREKVISDTLLKIINNKLLFEFYVKLLREEKSIVSSIKNFVQWQVDNIIKEKKDDWYYYKYKIKNNTKAEIKLQQIRKDIQSIENGYYNIFYDSNVYLYSLQKECPHFEQVIKQST